MNKLFKIDPENIVAIGTGFKNKNKEYATIFSVKKKKPLEEIPKKNRIPKIIGNEPTDVIETGTIRTLQWPEYATPKQAMDSIPDRQKRMRPAKGGCSIGHKQVTAGTFGVLVKNTMGEIMILSNNHVLANSNNAEIGDEIVQPGIHDGGTVEFDTIAILEKFVPIQMAGLPSNCNVGNAVANVLNFLAKTFGRSTRLVPLKMDMPVNQVDAAIARPINLNDVTDEIIKIGSLDVGYEIPDLGQSVSKFGRTTGLTHGKVSQINVSTMVQYGEGKMAYFEDQIMIESADERSFSQPGDSGSVIVVTRPDSKKYFAGLLFAGSDAVTIANDPHSVAVKLGLNL